jgi:NAD(P)-dependent dehydrogenase (short-subunit alcohol dehydrogenase family)
VTRALVTGASSGIGRAAACRLAAAGVSTWAGVRDAKSVQELEKLGSPELSPVILDVSDQRSIEAARDVVAGSGGLDVLVNNAGIAGPTGPVEELSQEDWRRTLAINLEGQFLCTRRAVPLLRQAGGGAIINLSSAAGRFGFARRTPYSASKWGVVGFTKSLAVELGPDNIRVNAILPGAVDGPRIRRVIAAKAESVGVSYQEMEAKYVSQASLKRMVTADDIAAMAVFLASPAGYNISGQALSVDADTQYLI